MKLAKIILYSVGVFFAVVLIIFSTKSVEFEDNEIYIKIREYYPALIGSGTDRYYWHLLDVFLILLNMANIAFMFLNIFLKKSMRGFIIATIVISVFTYNIFSIVASIIALIMRNDEERKNEEQEKNEEQARLDAQRKYEAQKILEEIRKIDEQKKLDEQKILEAQRILEEKRRLDEKKEFEAQRQFEISQEQISSSTDIIAEEKQKEVKKSIRLNVSSKELTFSIIGLVLEVIFIFAYLFTVMYFDKEITDIFRIKNPEKWGLAIIFVGLFYVILILAIFLIPILLMAANIAFTVLMITTKKPVFARLASVFGFINLTIFNSIAGIMLLNKYYDELAQESLN